jgi:hypothetical protein
MMGDMRRLALLLPLLLATPGCVFYFGDDGDDDCWNGGGAPEPWPGLRNPETGQCENAGGGGGGWCGEDGVPVPATDSAEAPADQIAYDWATCTGPCDGLSESACQAADGCRAVYVDDCPFCDIYPPQLTYVACWGTAPSGPVRGGGCQGLDAYDCSRHDDCSAVHWRAEVPAGGGFVNAIGGFEFCADEPGGGELGCYSDEECPMGTECTSDTECLPPPGCDPATGACPAVCYGRCVPIQAPDCTTLGEVDCIGRADCTPLYAGSDCTCGPMGFTCTTWTFESCVAGDGTSGAFPCGNLVCADGEFCQVNYPGIMGADIWYECRALPGQCLMGGNPLSTCECLKSANECAMSCDVDAAGHVTTGCYLP